MVGRHRGFGRVLDGLGLAGVPGLHIHPVAMWQAGPGRLLPFSWHGRYHRSALACLKRLGVDLVLVRHLKLAAFLLENWRGPGRRLVYEAHELFHQTAAENQMAPEKLAGLKQLEMQVLGGVDAVAAISRPLAEDVKPFLRPGAPLGLAPSGVDQEFFRVGVDREQNNLAAYAGGLAPWKGVDLLLKAMAGLEAGRLEVLGGREGGPDWQRLASLAPRPETWAEGLSCARPGTARRCWSFWAGLRWRCGPAAPGA